MKEFYFKINFVRFIDWFKKNKKILYNLKKT